MNSQNEKEGIGGWLILVLIGLIVTPIRLIVLLVRDFLPLFKTMSIFADYPMLKTMIYVEGGVNIIFTYFALFLLYKMVQRDRRFPRWMIIFYVCNLTFVVLDAVFVSNIEMLNQFVSAEESMKEIVRSVIGVIIWVPYLLNSTRVKLTFVNG